jgi:cellulose synthase/poly-beta-1,6-N-acetylglucosamine synthase-like glycosyltransferase
MDTSALITLLFFLFSGFYFALLYFIYLGLMRLRAAEQKHTPTVSIIVAARNEEKRIDSCLKSLESLDYPVEKYEVILVDDNSSDQTAQLIDQTCQKHENWTLIRLAEKSVELRGKKNALQNGINRAKGELIFTTDADCSVPPGWLRSMVNYFSADVSMVLGYSPLIRESKSYYRLLQFDNLFSAIAASAPVKLGYPFTSVGRNLAYRKSEYEKTGGFRALKKFRSGDDIHLTKRFHHHNGGRIDYCADPATFVKTLIPSRFCEVLQQQIRKNSKTFQLSFPTILAMLALFIHYLLLLFLPIFVSVILLPWLIVVIFKFVMEFIVLRKAARIFRQSDLIPIIPLMQIIYPWYIIIFSLLGSLQFYQWKK